MASQSLKIIEVEQAGDALTVVFNDGRTVVYSVSMLDSEFEDIQGALAEEPAPANPAHAEPVQGTKRAGYKRAGSKRPGSEARPLPSWRSAKAS
jgi:hypothetical protein